MLTLRSPLSLLLLLALALSLVSACSPLVLPETAIPASPPGSIPPSETVANPPPGEQLHFSRLGTADGLSQSDVLSILQDSRGFMWFGTEDGLNRYDGYEIKVYRPDPEDPQSLGDLWINTLHEDHDGIIWVGTRQGGLNRFDPLTGTFTQFTFDSEIPGSLSGNRVQAIFEDSRGRLWVGTENGLNLFNPRTNTFSYYSGQSSGSPIPVRDTIQAIAENSQGQLWIGTGSNGLWLLDPDRKEASQFQHITGDPNSLSNNNIQDIIVEANDSIWIATANGLNHYSPASRQFKIYRHTINNPNSLAHNNIHTLLIDRIGVFWVGTHDGLDRYDKERDGFIHYRHNPNIPTSLSSDTILKLYEDQSGIVWIGTFTGGLSLYDPYRNKFTHYYYDPDKPNGLGSNFILPIYIDDHGIVWIGTYGNGLDRFDPDTKTFTHIRRSARDFGSLQNNRVWSVLVDSSGTLWVGVESGLDQLSRETNNFIHYTHKPGDDGSLPGSTVYDLYEDENQTLWVATENGLGRFDPATEKFVVYRRDNFNSNSLSDNKILTIAPGPNGTLWLGTFNGGFDSLDPQTGKIVRYVSNPFDANSLSHNSVLSLHQDENGFLWIGTAGGGLNRYDPETDSFKVYRKEDGLANNVVYGILEDDSGLLWLSTNFGISRFNPFTETFKNFTVDDGLQSNQFNQNAYAQDAHGRLYFGGVNGLTVFDPVNVVGNLYIPPVVLTSLTVNGQPYITDGSLESLQGITLSWPNNSFEFEFAALSYSKPELNQFAFTLEGVDSEWYYAAGSRIGRYPSLPGGDYVLRLKASNSDGVWNEIGVAIPIHVIPPFWEMWVFRAGMGLLAILVVVSGYRYRVKRIEANTRELERQVTERTREIAALFEQTKELAVLEERNRLARELHDSAKQKAFAALAQLAAANGLIRRDIEAAKFHLDESENLVYEVIQEMTFLIQEIHPVALKEKGLATMLREYAFEWENRNNASIELAITNEGPILLATEQTLYRVVQEGLANVARHSRASAVSIRLAYNQDTVDLEISDNGCGFDMQKKPNGMGLRSIRERVESVGGAFVIASEPGRGTELSIQVPIDRSE